MESQMNYWVVLYILLWHWIADFVFQTDKMAQGKSKENFWLIYHTWIYSVLMTGSYGVLMLFAACKEVDVPHPITMLYFFVITFSVHTVQDYITSRINSKLWKEGKVHYFFVSVGFDQLLHFIQLLTTYQILTK